MSAAALALLLGAAGAAPLASWSLESDDGGFVSGGETGQWAWGAVASGPGAGIDGSHAWGTVLDGPHLNDTTDTLTLPPVDLRAVARPVLGFQHWYALDTGGVGDAGRVEVWDGEAWVTAEPVYGYPTAAGWQGLSEGWETAWFDLSGVEDAAWVRFVLASDGSVALDGWYVDEVRLDAGDVIPPRIEAVAGPADPAPYGTALAVTVQVVDDLGVRGVEVVWETSEGGGRTALASLFGDTWGGALPALPPDTEVTWWVEATDGLNKATSEEASFRVHLPAPTDLWGPDGRVVAREVQVGWTAPDSAVPVTGYRVYVDGALAASPTTPTTTLVLSARDPVVRVSAVYDTELGAWEGDPSAPLALDVAYPLVVGVTPAEAYQGDRVRLVVAGQDLLLAQGAVALSAGPGVQVDEIDVQDVNTASFQVTVDPAAAAGSRDLALWTSGVEVPAPGAFTVLDGADRPAITSLAPATLIQGEHARLVVELSAPPAGDALTLDLGSGVIVEAVTVDGARVTADVAVSPDAPVGARAVVVDDGTRFIEGASLRVSKPAAPATRVCGLGQAGGGLSPAALAVAAGLAAAARRRRRRGAPPPRAGA